MPHTSTPPRRIALVTTELGVGGAEKMLVALACGLDRDRFAPVVYVLGLPPARERDSLAHQLDEAGVPCHFMGGSTSWQVPFVFRRLLRQLTIARPQLVQTFLWHANTLGVVAARWAGTGPVVTGIRVAEHNHPGRLWIARRLARWSACHVCVSRAVAEFTSTQAGIARERLTVIPNGIDPSRFPAEPVELTSLGLTPARRALVTVGRFERQKGFDQLLSITSSVLGRLPEHDLILAGDGPLRGALQAQVRRLGLEGRVHFVGWQKDVAPLLAAADVLVLPSRYEGMPNVLLESMASARAVAALRVEGVVELLADDEGSETVQLQTAHRGDLAGLADRIVALARDSDLATRMGMANRDRIASRFTLHTMVASYQRLYDQVLGR